MGTDNLFYRLMQAQPALAFELIGLDVPEPSRYRFISQEIKQTAFRLDGLIEPPEDCSEAPRGYVEVQFQPDDIFYPRFLGEILLHLRQCPGLRPWQAVAIYPAPPPSASRPAQTPSWLCPTCTGSTSTNCPCSTAQTPNSGSSP